MVLIACQLSIENLPLLLQCYWLSRPGQSCTHRYVSCKSTPWHELQVCDEAVSKQECILIIAHKGGMKDVAACMARLSSRGLCQHSRAHPPHCLFAHRPCSWMGNACSMLCMCGSARVCPCMIYASTSKICGEGHLCSKTHWPLSLHLNCAALPARGKDHRGAHLGDTFECCWVQSIAQQCLTFIYDRSYCLDAHLCSRMHWPLSLRQTLTAPRSPAVAKTTEEPSLATALKAAGSRALKVS